MSSGNRVEKLEETVQELEATVEGLTEELVEANERIRQLEDALSGTPDEHDTTDEESETELIVGGEGEPEEPEDDLQDQFEVEADPDDVEEATAGVAPSGTADRDDTSKGSEDDAGDEGESDDIIVA